MEVPVRVHDLENIGTSGQNLSAGASNFDWRAESDDSLPVNFVGLCFRRGEYTERGKA
jgi:hypothetical protein